MAIQAQSADGVVHEFPDGTDPSVIDGVMKNYAMQQQPVQPPSASPQPSNTQPLSFGEHVAAGIQDPFMAAAQLAAHASPDFVERAANWTTNKIDDVLGVDHKPAMTKEQLDAGLKSMEQDYQSRRAAGLPPGTQPGTDWGRMGGNIVGAIPLMTMMPEAAGGSLGGAALTGAGTGAVMGAAQPVTNDQDDFWKQKGFQAATGAGTGAVMGPATELLARAISPTVRPAVQTLLDANVTPTPGQIIGGSAAKIEDMAKSLPGTGLMINRAQGRAIQDFNRAVYDETLAPLGVKSSAPVGREAVGEVRDQLTKAYNDILPQVTWKADAQFGTDLANLQGMASSLPEPQAKQFDTFLKNNLVGKLSKTGQMDGQTFKGVQENFADAARGYMGDPNFDNRQLGSALAEVNNAMKDTLVRSNPQQADRLNAINNSYAMFVRLRRAAGSLGAAGQEEGNGMFTPAQLLNAVKAEDKSAGKGAFARGDALLQNLAESGKEVLGSKYPDSGTAGRIMMMESMKAAPLLAAHEAGVPPSALMATGAGLGLASLPYTQVGQRLAAAMMTKRPPGAASLAEIVRQGLPAAQMGTTGLLLNPSP